MPDSPYYQSLSPLEKTYYNYFWSLFLRVDAAQPEKGIRSLLKRARLKADKDNREQDLQTYLALELSDATERTEKRLALINNNPCPLTKPASKTSLQNSAEALPPTIFSTIAINKPIGMTSHDVVSRLRRIYNIKKIGHLGTLDPLAEGVLPLCLGQATRLIEYFPDDKRYHAEITLGKTTTTLDSEGDILTDIDCSDYQLTLNTVNEILEQFKGSTLQQVPLYSAVHVKGKKLYEIARQGIENLDFVLPSRPVTIHALKCLSLSQENTAKPVLKIDIHCSSGTYIRSLARDIGEALGCGAYMSGLTRTHHGQFTLENCVSLTDLEQSDNPIIFLKNPLPFVQLPQLNLTDSNSIKQLINGMKLPCSAFLEKEMTYVKANRYAIVITDSRTLGVVQRVGQLIKPLKIFHSGQ